MAGFAVARGATPNNRSMIVMEDCSPMASTRRPVCFAVAALVTCVLLLAGPPIQAQSLRASGASMDLQNQQAVLHGFTFARTSDDVRDLIDSGALLPITGNRHFIVKESVTFPYARPEVRAFIANLAKHYYEACDEQLVVTSLTRARNRQPRNASKRSVHPTGMAIDLRRSWNRGCRSWMEMTLLTLEVNGVVDAMLESRPPHYHVALFPTAWRRSGEEILDRGEPTHYQVSRGDTLWKIAKRHNTDVYSVKKINGLRSDSIYIGQVLQLPSSR